jgi:hypothetical protein
MSDSPTDDLVQDENQISEESSASDNLDAQSTEDSSTSEESKPEATTLDTINKALEQDAEDDDDTEGSSEEDKSVDKGPEGTESKDEDSDDDITKDELKLMKAKTRKWFEQLQGKYRDTKTENQDLKKKLESTEVDATHYRQLTEFLTVNNINQDEANTLMTIGAMMKNDPQRALQMIQPYVRDLMQVTGNVLPPDLHEQVQQGYMTEAAALELSRQRALNQQYQLQQQHQSQRQQQEDVNRQQRLGSDIQTALAGLESKWRTSDPDYKMKAARVLERVELMWFKAKQTNQLPKSVDEAVQMAERVKKEVDQEIKNFTPQRKTVNPPIDGGTNASTRPAPRSTLDVINQTVGG